MSNIINEKFNYLSIDFQGKEVQEIILNKITLEALKKINNTFNLKGTTQELIDLLTENNIEKIQTDLGYKFPHKNEKDHWHLTVYFKNKKSPFLSQEAINILEGFQKNQIVSVNILALIYIPDKILTFFCKPDCMISNKYGHITILIKDVNAVFSNVVLETIFENDQYFKKDYDHMISLENNDCSNNIEFIKHCVINNFELNEEDCFICKFDRDLYKLEGKMKLNF